MSGKLRSTTRKTRRRKTIKPGKLRPWQTGRQRNSAKYEKCKEIFSYVFDFCCLRNGFFPAHVTAKQQRAVGMNTCFTWHLATTRKLERIKKRGRCSFNKAVFRLRGEVIYFSFSWKVAFLYHCKFYSPSQNVKVLLAESAAKHIKVITHHKPLTHSELLAVCLVVKFNLYVLRLKSF